MYRQYGRTLRENSVKIFILMTLHTYSSLMVGLSPSVSFHLWSALPNPPPSFNN